MKNGLDAEVLYTDVLIVGGGMAGLMAAISARASGGEVICVDKGRVGWAGQVPTSGGMGVVCDSDAAAERWVKWEIAEGAYLNNQEWTEIFAIEGYKRFAEMARWSCPIHLKDDGKLMLYPRRDTFTVIRFDAKRILLSLKKKALAVGVRFIDRFNMVELIKRDKRVAGAYGFDVDSGQFRAVVAKETIIANGSCNYKIRKLFTVNCGEGVSAAYDAGAEMMNAEFGNSYGYSVKYYDVFGRGYSYDFFLKNFVNSRGERLVERYDISRVEDIYYKVVRVMGQEAIAGRGPILVDLTGVNQEELAFIRSQERMGLNMWSVLPRAGIDPTKEKVEWVPVLTGKLGAIRVDTRCRSSLDGLWAAGDAISLGSAWTGAVAPGNMPGLGIPFAAVSGFRAGESAGMSARHLPPVGSVTGSEIAEWEKGLFRPLSKVNGKEPTEVIHQIQEVVYPLKYNFFRRKDRLEEGLERICRISSLIGDMTAKDFHALAYCYQARAMAICAEMTFRAALQRTETRATHLREDYPERDDENWLRWICIRGEREQMVLSTEPVPIEQYKYHPQAEKRPIHRM